ncbi:unnamed protein product [Macrosiphum euphorbiae]|uniref:Uncharacterized protein n=1 Tax=Macrosiphum euphorbiae TaxID=13131 RepID=A0AAV0W325_9HEMI|nr:unnamed protein product [Macrosiphum euphorbiae]
MQKKYHKNATTILYLSSPRLDDGASVPVENDVNKVNAAFCGMRFQQYRTSLTMFYWKSPFEICGGPVHCFFSIPPRRATTTVRRLLQCYGRRSDVRVGRDLASGGARSSGPNAEQDVRKIVLWSFLGDYHLSSGRTRRRSCGCKVLRATCYERRESRRTCRLAEDVRR